MLKPEQYVVFVFMASSLAVAPVSTALAGEDIKKDEVGREVGEQDAGEEGEDEEASSEETEGEGPVLPEGMTLDEVLDRAEETPAEDYTNPVPDSHFRAFLLVDQLEYRFDLEGQTDQVGTELQGYIGGDYNRLWLKTEGETGWQGEAGFEGETESDLLYGRLITPFWNAQIGVQYANEWTVDEYEDIWSGAVAFQGLAPGMFELDVSLYVTENLNMLADLEAEYDIRITQRLVFQPRTELSFSAQDIPERGIGFGLTKAIVDLRLRYEFLREFAPYVGVRYRGLVGETANLAEAAGEDPSRFWLLGGVRFAVY
jgi:copper resistance protein B